MKREGALPEKAFMLYSTGTAINEIGRQLNLHKTTLYNWREKFNWEERKKKIELAAMETTDNFTTEIKRRQHQLLKAMMGAYADDLRAKKVHPNSSDILSAFRHELQLFGELKPELNITVNTFFDDIKEALKHVQGRASAIDIKPERVSQGPVPERKQ